MYLKLFLTFVKIGLFTIGGGHAVIPLLEREIIKNKWMTVEEFYDLLAVTQALPGVFAVNISLFVGYRMKNLAGSIVCGLATILPAFSIMLVIAIFFGKIQDNIWIERIFKGLRPAVVALIAVPCISAAKAMKLTYGGVLVAAIAAFSIWYAHISPIFVIITAAFGGILYSSLKKDNK